MSNDGGRSDEPTSYGLQPPHAPQAPNRQVPQSPYAQSATPQTPLSPQHSHQDQGQGPHQNPAPAPDAPDPDQQTQVAAQGPQSGRVIGGRYRLVERLGHGGMGTVWRAHDQVVDRDVAVKEPRVPDHLSERERQKVYQRMQREARAAARIDHPAVVTVHDVVVEDGRPWIVMELVRGHSLADRLQEGTLDPREAARIGLHVLGALSAAHEAGVLHRDVKPDNVLLGRHDRVVLTDFGIAQVEGEQRLTETGAFIGSPEFVAPERVLGQRPGPESDLWSLGVVLYAAVEGMSPYRRSNAPATLQAVLSAEPQLPARGSGALGTLIMQLLRKDPAARPPAAEVKQILESAARPPQPSPIVPGLTGAAAPGGSRWLPPVLHRNRKAQFGLGGAALALAVVLVLLLANPFTGDELPANWEVRPEGETVAADVAVPKDYTRVAGTDNTNVTFNDPSGVFTIYLEHILPKENKRPFGKVGQEARKWVRFYKKGGENGTDIQEVKSVERPTTQRGGEARDIITSFRDYAAATDAIRYRWHERLVVAKGGKAYWRLRVTMPDRGEAAKGGEQLFANVARFLKIRGL